MTDLSHPRHADEVAAVFDYDRLRSGMPVSGQSRRFDRVPPTSALPPKTDIHREGRHVSNVPFPDSCTAANSYSITSSAGAHRRHGEAERNGAFPGY
jgi:hypothetical protein